RRASARNSSVASANITPSVTYSGSSAPSGSRSAPCSRPQRFSSPRSMAPPATSAAVHQLAPRANKSTGTGASHMQGQNGLRPVPNQTSTAVASMATMPGTERLTSIADAIEVSPERAPVKRAEGGGRHIHAAAEVQHDEAVRQRPHLEGDLPRVVLPQLTLAMPSAMTSAIRVAVGDLRALKS